MDAAEIIGKRYQPMAEAIGGTPSVVKSARGARGYRKPTFIYDKPGEDGDIDPFLVADVTLTKMISEKLQKHYPAHAWMVQVSHAQGCAFISIPVLTGRRKYVLHISALKSDPTLVSVMRAGGEILERCGLSRLGFSTDEFLSALNSKPLIKRAYHGIIQV
jgi:hypothetical protein